VLFETFWFCLQVVSETFWFCLQVVSETFLILRRIQRDIIKMYIGLHVKYRLLLLSDCNET
jgi:hypothetical protein